jgi:hypothetical protein
VPIEFVGLDAKMDMPSRRIPISGNVAGEAGFGHGAVVLHFHSSRCGRARCTTDAVGAARIGTACVGTACCHTLYSRIYDEMLRIAVCPFYLADLG